MSDIVPSRVLEWTALLLNDKETAERKRTAVGLVKAYVKDTIESTSHKYEKLPSICVEWFLMNHDAVHSTTTRDLEFTIQRQEG